MPEKLRSRKLWAFIGVMLLVVCNFVWNLGMPPSDVLYLVALTASYILGQGYVDAKQQTVASLPIEDVTDSVASILQAEISKLPTVKDLPIADIMDAFKVMLAGELTKLNTDQNLTSDDLMKYV